MIVSASGNSVFSACAASCTVPAPASVLPPPWSPPPQPPWSAPPLAREVGATEQERQQHVVSEPVAAGLCFDLKCWF